MCARYTLYHPIGLVARQFAALSDLLNAQDGPTESLADTPESRERSGGAYEPSYNIAPTDRIVVVCEDGRRALRLMRWGLIPHWAGARQAARPLVNARAETLTEKPSFRDALAKRRCIVPASGFYEWKKAGRERLPCYITRRDGEPMAFAGLWERWDSPNGLVETCAIVTVPANHVIEPLHDRMPALLGHDNEAAWLDVGGTDADTAHELLRPCPDDWIQMHPVSPRMNRQIVNDPECIVPAGHQTAATGSLFGDDW